MLELIRFFVQQFLSISHDRVTKAMKRCTECMVILSPVLIYIKLLQVTLKESHILAVINSQIFPPSSNKCYLTTGLKMMLKTVENCKMLHEKFHICFTNTQRKMATKLASNHVFSLAMENFICAKPIQNTFKCYNHILQIVL